MGKKQIFSFSRARGIVWVCDLQNSTALLNNDSFVEDFEAFLPRLFWVSQKLIEAAGGRLIKWTGDGFFAWFEVPLYRSLGKCAATVFKAAWHLTYLVNLTQLGLAPKGKFKIHHGITFEQDAFIIRDREKDKKHNLDILGRAIVLAFRLTGIRTHFPNIVTQGDLVKAVRKVEANNQRVFKDFEKLKITPTERLKYFKGEKWGTESIYVPIKDKRRITSHASLTQKMGQLLIRIERSKSLKAKEISFIYLFASEMLMGPSWARKIMKKDLLFTREMFEFLKKAHKHMKGHLKKKRPK